MTQTSSYGTAGTQSLKFLYKYSQVYNTGKQQENHRKKKEIFNAMAVAITLGNQAFSE